MIDQTLSNWAHANRAAYSRTEEQGATVYSVRVGSNVVCVREADGFYHLRCGHTLIRTRNFGNVIAWLDKLVGRMEGEG